MCMTLSGCGGMTSTCSSPSKLASSGYESLLESAEKNGFIITTHLVVLETFSFFYSSMEEIDGHDNGMGKLR